MAYCEKLADRIREALSPLPDVKEENDFNHWIKLATDFNKKLSFTNS